MEGDQNSKAYIGIGDIKKGMFACGIPCSLSPCFLSTLGPAVHTRVGLADMPSRCCVVHRQLAHGER